MAQLGEVDIHISYPSKEIVALFGLHGVCNSRRHASASPPRRQSSMPEARRYRASKSVRESAVMGALLSKTENNCLSDT